MNNIFTIVKKEFIDILRDRKTLMMTFLVPILILPFVFYFSMSASMNMMNVDETKVYPIALNSDSETLKDLFKQTNYFEITDQLGNDAIEAVYQDDIIAYIDIPDHYEEALTRGENPTIDLYYDVSSTSSEAAVMVIQELLGQYKKNITASILTSLSVSPSLLEDIPFEVHYKDDDSNPISMMILGMMVPMLIIGYSASGITPIATDLGAGEKERGTLEPLLTTKSKRSHIFIAKLIVTSIFGAITSILSIIGVMVSLHDSLCYLYQCITTDGVYLCKIYQRSQYVFNTSFTSSYHVKYLHYVYGSQRCDHLVIPYSNFKYSLSR